MPCSCSTCCWELCSLTSEGLGRRGSPALALAYAGGAGAA